MVATFAQVIKQLNPIQSVYHKASSGAITGRNYGPRAIPKIITSKQLPVRGNIIHEIGAAFTQPVKGVNDFGAANLIMPGFGGVVKGTGTAIKGGFTGIKNILSKYEKSKFLPKLQKTGKALGGAALFEYSITGKFPDITARTLAGYGATALSLPGTLIGGITGGIKNIGDVLEKAKGKIPTVEKVNDVLNSTVPFPNLDKPISGLPPFIGLGPSQPFNFVGPSYAPPSLTGGSISIGSGGGGDMAPLLLALLAGGIGGGYLLGRKKRKRRKYKKRRKH